MAVLAATLATLGATGVRAAEPAAGTARAIHVARESGYDDERALRSDGEAAAVARRVCAIVDARRGGGITVAELAAHLGEAYERVSTVAVDPHYKWVIIDGVPTLVCCESELVLVEDPGLAEPVVVTVLDEVEL